MTGVTPTCPQGPCWDRESVRTQQQVPRAGGVAGVQGACCGSLLAWASAPLLSVSEGVLGSHFRVGRGGAGWREQQDVAFASTPTDTSCLGQERGAPWHPQSQEIRYGEEVACPGLLRAWCGRTRRPAQSRLWAWLRTLGSARWPAGAHAGWTPRVLSGGASEHGTPLGGFPREAQVSLPRLTPPAGPKL